MLLSNIAYERPGLQLAKEHAHAVIGLLVVDTCTEVVASDQAQNSAFPCRAATASECPMLQSLLPCVTPAYMVNHILQSLIVAKASFTKNC